MANLIWMIIKLNNEFGKYFIKIDANTDYDFVINIKKLKWRPKQNCLKVYISMFFR